MGYIRHHTICVTSWNEIALKDIHNKSLEICKKYEFNLVTSIYGSHVNGYFSFFIIPDGSKEGWHDSDIGDMVREQIIDYIDLKMYEDGSNPISYAELYYGDEMGQSKIINHN